MRLLHTSDWHLGQKFVSQNREPEQQMALDWLYEQIVQHTPDVLVVAGDVFDVGNPPVSAEEMYYRFLTRLTGTACRYVVIVGGNHDSPQRLNAPRGLLRALRMYVVGAAPASVEEAVIPILDTEGHTQALIAAVPFLRERDFDAVTVLGENANDRVARIQQGIAQYYAQMADAAGAFKGPVIATGHLFAKGASTHDEQQNIYLGNMDNIAAETLPKRFNYVALGHIHRMQTVGKKPHIRYCGSLIPLSFSEKQDKKGILLADFDTKGLTQVQEIPAPTFRELVTLKGTLDEVTAELHQLHDRSKALPTWVEAIITGDPGVALVDQYLREQCKDLRVEVLKVKVEHRQRSLQQEMPQQDLASLDPKEVFLKKCSAAGLNETETAQMTTAFNELVEWMESESTPLD